MKTMIRFALGIQRLIGSLLGLILRWRGGVPPIQWPALPNSAAVGVTDIVIDGSDYPEPRQPGTPRDLLCRIWYPAQADVNPATLHLAHEGSALAQGLRASISLPEFVTEAFGRTAVHGRPDASAAAGAPLPVVLFSPGYSGVLGQNTHLAEHLVASGYLVIALDHPYGTAASAFPDGRSIVPSDAVRGEMMTTEVVRAGLALKKAKSRAERLALMPDYASLAPMVAEQSRWVADIRRALDQLPTLPHPALARADWQRLCLAGMSFGGAASANAAIDDARVKAVVNLDGGQVGTALLDTAIEQPLLMMHSAFARFKDGGCFNDFFYEPLASAGQRPDIWRLVVDDTGHLDFSDSSLLGNTVMRLLLQTGKLGAERMLPLTAEVVTAFLDRHLCEQDGPGIEQLCARWPALKTVDMEPVRGLVTAHG